MSQLSAGAQKHLLGQETFGFEPKEHLFGCDIVRPADPVVTPPTCVEIEQNPMRTCKLLLFVAPNTPGETAPSPADPQQRDVWVRK